MTHNDTLYHRGVPDAPAVAETTLLLMLILTLVDHLNDFHSFSYLNMQNYISMFVFQKLPSTPLMCTTTRLIFRHQVSRILYSNISK